MTIDERLDRIAANLDMITKLHLDAERQHEERTAAWEQRMAASDQRAAAWEERMAASDRRAADWEERIAASEERIAASEERIAEFEARHDRQMTGIRTELRRAIVLSIREARQERSKRRQIDDKITQLAAAQLVTEEKLQRLLEHRSGNGNP